MFSHLQPVATDPILGLMAAYKEDPNPLKVDLGVGVYKDEQGHTAVLDCVKKAEKLRLDHEDSKTYIGMAGDLSFNAHIEKLAFGPHKVLLEGRTTTAHTPGGTGALRVAAEFIKKANPDATIWVTSPTWANHISMFQAAGLKVKEYAYYDYETKGLKEDDLSRFLDLRQELFEIDTRFVQLGGNGIFSALDRAGLLTHHVAGVENIDVAVVRPPVTGRARLRGECVRRLAGTNGDLVCDWDGIWDEQQKRALDLSDPFETQERWVSWPKNKGELTAAGHGFMARLRRVQQDLRTRLRS